MQTVSGEPAATTQKISASVEPVESQKTSATEILENNFGAKAQSTELPKNVEPESTMQQVQSVEQAKTDKPAVLSPSLELKLAQLNNDNWWQLVDVLNIAGVSKSIALSCVVDEVREPHSVTLILDETQATLYNEQHKGRIENSLREYFSDAVTLQINLAAVKTETPAQRKLRIAAEQLEQAKVLIAEDPFIKALEAQMGAQLLPDSIRYYSDENEA